jgi:hypothetical protein
MMMTLTRTRVLLYSNETLFEAGVSSIIASDQNLDLTIVKATGMAELIKVTQELQPQVILIEQCLLDTQFDLFGQLLLMDLKDSRVITLDQNHNLLHVYTSCDISIQQASDLIEVIRSPINCSNNPLEKE